MTNPSKSRSPLRIDFKKGPEESGTKFMALYEAITLPILDDMLPLYPCVL